MDREDFSLFCDPVHVVRSRVVRSLVGVAKGRIDDPACKITGKE